MGTTIKMYLKEIGCESVDWIQLALCGFNRLTLANKVKKELLKAINDKNLLNI
jgi:hypothetical protein